MFQQKKKKQHYVWRRYLKAWCPGGKIACMRNELHIFSTELMKVGQQSYFYKVNELNIDDIIYVKKMFLSDTPHGVSLIYDRLFSLFSMVEHIERLVVDESDKDLYLLKKNYAKNLEEEIQSDIESQGDKYLSLLLEGDTSFFETEKGAAYFINYICMQYLRTKKQQESLIKGFSGENKDQIIRCINLIRIVFSTKLASNLFVNRHNYKLVLVNNLSNVDLITSDQPIINFMEINNPEGGEVIDFGLYYPISPKRAVFFVEHNMFGSIKTMGFNEETVHEYNQMMIKSSYEQVYSTSESQLQDLVIDET